MRAQEVLIEICIYYSLTEKSIRKDPFSSLLLSTVSPGPYEECKLYLLEQGMKRRNEEEGGGKGGKGRMEKLSGLSSHLILQTKCLISLPASPFCSLAPIAGSN